MCAHEYRSRLQLPCNKSCLFQEPHHSPCSVVSRIQTTVKVMFATAQRALPTSSDCVSSRTHGRCGRRQQHCARRQSLHVEFPLRLALHEHKRPAKRGRMGTTPAVGESPVMDNTGSPRRGSSTAGTTEVGRSRCTLSEGHVGPIHSQPGPSVSDSTVPALDPGHRTSYLRSICIARHAGRRRSGR